MCTKVHYESRKEARAAARRYAALSRGRQYPYWCRYCQAWHLSSMDTKQAKSINKARKQRRREREQQRYAIYE